MGKENKIELFRQAFINKEICGVIVTEDIFTKALNKCVGDKRYKYKLSKSYPKEDIIEKYVDFDDVIRAINSAANLQTKKPVNNVKFDDVRNMSLRLDNLEGYTKAEKKFVQQRLCELSGEFDLEKSTDKFLAYRVVLCELKIMQLETLIVMNPKLAKEVQAQAQIDLLDRQYKIFCESLNALKRQRDNTKGKQKESQTNLADIINKLDKSIPELEAEVAKERQQEIEMIKKRNTKLKKEAKK